MYTIETGCEFQLLVRECPKMATNSHVMPPERADDRDILTRAACPAEWVPLPNGRLGLAVPCKKRRVFLAADGRTRLCEHGETASDISQYSNSSRTRPVDSACPYA